MVDMSGMEEISRTGEALAAKATSAEFYAEMKSANVAPLWDRYNQLMPNEPQPPDAGIHWKYDLLRPLLHRAAREISMDEAERRVVMLLNPTYEGRCISTTGLYGAIQILNPGESARPHRHTSAAFRFVMEGNGAVTTVNGKPCEMLEGDVILTPNWAWHEHSHPGDDTIVWFNGLDVPLADFYNVGFHQHGPAGNFPPNQSTLPDAAFALGGFAPVTEASAVPSSPMFRYPWSNVLEALRHTPANRDGSRCIRYVDPVTGGAVMPTMDLYVLDLPERTETRAYRTTANAMCVVAEGEGESRVGDAKIVWRKGDIFTLPHWTWISHKATAKGAKLFQSTDRALLDRLQFLREEFA